MPSPESEALRVQVERIKGVVPSAVATINGFAQYVRDHADDPVALRAYADSLTADADALATAITANPLPGEVVTPSAAPKK